MCTPMCHVLNSFGLLHGCQIKIVDELILSEEKNQCRDEISKTYICINKQLKRGEPSTGIDRLSTKKIKARPGSTE